MDVVSYAAASLVLWAVTVPLSARVFRRFPDAGAGLAFPLGLILTGTSYFLLRSLDLLEAGRGGFLIASLVPALLSANVLGRDRHAAGTLRDRRRTIAGLAALFLVAFLAFAYYRSFVSDIAGTEQPMDFLYLNTVMESPNYPPADPWLAGHTASYYYFGHLQAGTMTAIAGVPSAVGYNLALAWTFGASAAAAFSVAMALGRWAIGRKPGRVPALAGTAAVVLLLFAGTVVGIFELAAAHERYSDGLYEAFGVEWLLPCAPGEQAGGCYAGASPRTTEWYPTEFWFWFRGTRLIPGTIGEFPFFSFLLGDLHAHMTAIPGLLLATGLAMTGWRARGALAWRSAIRDPLAFGLAAVVLGSLAFQNAWDVVTFGALFVAAAAARWSRAPGGRAAVDTLGYLALVALAAGALFAPWWTTFSSQANGFYAYVGTGTRVPHALLHFGVLGAAGIAVLAATPRLVRRNPGMPAAAASWLTVLPFLAWGVLAAYQANLNAAFDARGASGWAVLASYAVIAFAASTLTLAAVRSRHAAAGPLVLAATGFMLLYGIELFFVRDVFFGSVPRLNTFFKLSYQAWLLLSLAGGVGLAVCAARGPGRAATRLVAAAVVLVTALGVVYAVISVPNRTEAFARPQDLDGLAFVRRSDPPEAALVDWVAANVAAGDVIVEATGRTWARGADGTLSVVRTDSDYTDAGRVSARTGRQAPIGWYFHQIQWRGEGIGAELNRRLELVDRVYLAATPTESMEAINALGARYVVYGHVEQARYPSNATTDFNAFLDLVFADGNVRVYRVPALEVRRT